MKPHLLLAATCLIVVTTAPPALAAAPAGRYTINAGAGTVYDTLTKLTWQQAVPASTYTWANAKTYCTGLNLGGYAVGTWRLPTMVELFGIVDRTTSNPAIDTTAFPSTPAEWFWSSTPYQPSSSSAWHVNFNNGYVNDFDVTVNYRVRCVR